MAAQDQRAKLVALDHIPMGARVASLVGASLPSIGGTCRATAISGAMVIARRQGFSNDQWDIVGTNLMQVTYKDAGCLRVRPVGDRSSEQLPDPQCLADFERPVARDWQVDEALAAIPRDKPSTMLWFIDVPPYDPKLTQGMTPVWQGSGSMLYRLDK